MAMYVKIFKTMYDGSLATRGPWEALVTFQQLLVLAEWDGTVDMTAEVISRRTIIPIEIIEKGIRELEKADPLSRNGSEDGRRIIRLSEHRDWGWRVVNIGLYRKIRSREEKNEYQRDLMRERRANVKEIKAPLSSDTSPVVEHIPMIGGVEFGVRQSFVDELTRLYPAVDIPATLRQMRGWCIGNPTKLKTPRGIRKFITGWCERDQNGS